jgi:hypothetical protein
VKPVDDNRRGYKAHPTIKFEKKIMYAPQGIKFKADLTGFQNLSGLEKKENDKTHHR